MTKILLVEDDPMIVSNLTAFLCSESYDVSNVSGQKDALEILQKERFDLILLDIALSDGNGFTLCKAIKSEYKTPIIFLTASDDEYSTVAAFEIGGDDYIPKPFRPRELLMRIRNVLRLYGNGETVIYLKDVVVDTIKGTATKNGKDLYLSALEYRLLLALLNNKGMVLSRAQLLHSIWDVGGDYVNDNTLTVYIKRLREKIEDDPTDPVIIKTVRGFGYKIDL